MHAEPVGAVPRPPGYPREYDSSLRLDDGRTVTVRPIVPSDAAELAEAIRTADADTLRTRFLGGPPPLSAKVMDRLTRLDYTTRFALVARYHGRGVAIARYAALPPSGDGSVAADVAVAVHPSFRRAGLASALIQLLARRALECGISSFTATFLADNRPVAELAHRSDARVIVADGLAELSRSTTADPGTPADRAPT